MQILGWFNMMRFKCKATPIIDKDYIYYTTAVELV